MNNNPTLPTPSERRRNLIVMEINDKEYTDLMTPAQLTHIKNWVRYILRKTDNSN